MKAITRSTWKERSKQVANNKKEHLISINIIKVQIVSWISTYGRAWRLHYMGYQETGKLSQLVKEQGTINAPKGPGTQGARCISGYKFNFPKHTHLDISECLSIHGFVSFLHQMLRKYNSTHAKHQNILTIELQKHCTSM